MCEVKHGDPAAWNGPIPMVNEVERRQDTDLHMRDGYGVRRSTNTVLGVFLGIGIFTNHQYIDKDEVDDLVPDFRRQHWRQGVRGGVDGWMRSMRLSALGRRARKRSRRVSAVEARGWQEHNGTRRASSTCPCFRVVPALPSSNRLSVDTSKGPRSSAINAVPAIVTRLASTCMHMPLSRTTTMSTKFGESAAAVALPFGAVGSFDFCNTGRPFPPRDYHILNYTTLETWKSLRLPKTREHQDLSMFPSMHLDILLQVLSHLHPLDLLHLSRTSREFRDLLHSPPGELLWRNSFGGDPGLPAPPESTAESYERIQPTSTLERRLLRECLDSPVPLGPYRRGNGRSSSTSTTSAMQASNRHKENTATNLLQHHRLGTSLPEYPPAHEIYTLIPKTRRTSGDAMVLRASSTPKFHPEEGKAVLKMYEDQQVQNDPVAFSEFVKSQRAVAAEIESAASNCAFWARHRVLDVVETRNHDCRKEIWKSVQKWLLKEGWEAIDIQAAAQKYERVRTTFAHDTHPNTPTLEAHTSIYRMCIQHAALNTLSEPIPGRDNEFYPPPHELTELPPLVALVQDPSRDELSPDDPRVMAFLTSSEARAFMDDWSVRTQAHLVSLLPTTTSTSESHLELLERATSVFRFPRRGFGIGWELARGHMHLFGDNGWRSRTPAQFSERGSATVQMLLDLLGVLESMSVTEMDSMGARFVCAGCPMAKHGRRALPWRECIEHDLKGKGGPAYAATKMTERLASRWRMLRTDICLDRETWNPEWSPN
ncbi:hypothetical protein FB45DRAFT_1131007 [Roridomyces roridus]|uniref:F-box domain-containing protein n=1 Tax=Roridomyces roridus TaxID=1738132 RepID=A0AAD7B215_9AGAR|nr:hypothetical protein FB45DRAFT_1131007 [Roridomyces roridus]